MTGGRGCHIRWPVVLFDLDGTVADSIDLIIASYTHALATVSGDSCPREEMLGWIGRTFEATLAKRDPDRAEELIAAYRAYNEAHIAQAVTAYPGVRDLLADLREAGVVTGVVTAKRRAVAQMTLAAAGLSDVIDLVGGQEDSLTHKPEPGPLLAASASLGVDVTTACYVGDAVTDLQAAQAAGMAAVAVTWGAGVEADLAACGPDAVCRDVGTLRDVLLKHA